MIKVEAQAEMLKDAMGIMSSRVDEVKKAVVKHCKDSHGGKDCEEVSEQQGCEMEPRYKAVKKEPVFKGRINMSQNSKCNVQYMLKSYTHRP